MINRCKAFAVACLVAITLALAVTPASATFKIADRVRQTSTTSGTGTLTLNSPAATDVSFATGIGVGNSTYYIIDDGAGNWEIGVGTVGSSTISRDTVILSSNGNSLVNFPAGTKTVICNVPSSRFLFMSSVLSPSTGDVLVYDGGWTNAPGSTALASARTKLGVTATGADTAYNARANNLSDVASVSSARANIGVTATGSDTTYMYRANNGSDIPNIATFRTNLHLDSASLYPTSAFDAAGAASTAQSNAETYAAGQASTAQSNAESYAASAASTAQSNAQASSLQSANNLADVANIATAKANLGVTEFGGWWTGNLSGSSVTYYARAGLWSVTRIGTGEFTITAPVSGRMILGIGVTSGGVVPVIGASAYSATSGYTIQFKNTNNANADPSDFTLIVL